MSYNEAVHYLYELQKYGTKFGLENIKKLLSHLGEPHKSFLSIHIAGTNGKGSTSAIIANLLYKYGLKVGLFTSPHILNFTERIRVNNEEISEVDVISLTNEIKDVIDKNKDFSPTFFEVVTSIAMVYFKRNKVDVGVIETGMGGRLDATNIIIPIVSVITHISYDHKEFLGNTIEDITYEKAGIIKNSIPVVSSHQEKKVTDLLEEVAVKKSSPFYLYGRDFWGEIKEIDVNGIVFDYNDNLVKIKDLFLPLTGEHQLFNACTAIKAILIFLENYHINDIKPQDNFVKNIVKDFIYIGLRSLKWNGRIELIRQNPPILIDGAHNPDSANALASTLKKVFKQIYSEFIIIFGIMNDKDVEGIMRPFLSIATDVIVTSPAYDRAASPERLYKIANSIGFKKVHKTKNTKDAIMLAEKIWSYKFSKTLIIITGSFYTIGEVKEFFGGDGILINLRE